MKSIKIKNIPSEQNRAAMYFDVAVVCNSEKIILEQMKLKSITINDDDAIKFRIWKMKINDPRYDNEEYETEELNELSDEDTIGFYNYSSLPKICISKNDKKINVEWKKVSSKLK